jgi:hypothetical protein
MAVITPLTFQILLAHRGAQSPRRYDWLARVGREGAESESMRLMSLLETAHAEAFPRPIRGRGVCGP